MIGITKLKSKQDIEDALEAQIKMQEIYTREGSRNLLVSALSMELVLRWVLGEVTAQTEEFDRALRDFQTWKQQQQKRANQ